MLYIDIWPFYSEFKFASLCFVGAPYICIGNMLRISNKLLLWSLWANIAHISWGASLGWVKIAKMIMVCWPRWPPCPYMVKTFKNLLLQNRRCLVAESLHKWSGMGGLPKLLKWWSYIDYWPFYGEVKFASLCICICTRHLYGKNVEDFKRLLLWSLLANVAQIFCGASLGWGNEILLKWLWSIDKVGCHIHIW